MLHPACVALLGELGVSEKNALNLAKKQPCTTTLGIHSLSLVADEPHKTTSSSVTNDAAQITKEKETTSSITFDRAAVLLLTNMDAAGDLIPEETSRAFYARHMLPYVAACFKEDVSSMDPASLEEHYEHGFRGSHLGLLIADDGSVQGHCIFVESAAEGRHEGTVVSQKYSSVFNEGSEEVAEKGKKEQDEEKEQEGIVEGGKSNDRRRAALEEEDETAQRRHRFLYLYGVACNPNAQGRGLATRLLVSVLRYIIIPDVAASEASERSAGGSPYVDPTGRHRHPTLLGARTANPAMFRVVPKVAQWLWVCREKGERQGGGSRSQPSVYPIDMWSHGGKGTGLIREGAAPRADIESLATSFVASCPKISDTLDKYQPEAMLFKQVYSPTRIAAFAPGKGAVGKEEGRDSVNYHPELGDAVFLVVDLRRL